MLSFPDPKNIFLVRSQILDMENISGLYDLISIGTLTWPGSLNVFGILINKWIQLACSGFSIYMECQWIVYISLPILAEDMMLLPKFFRDIEYGKCLLYLWEKSVPISD